MGAPQQPIHGRHTTFEILLNGVPQDVGPALTDFSAEPMYDKIETKYLGEAGQDIDHDPIGWKGSATCAVRSSGLDNLINAYNLAKRGLLPVVIQAVERVTYRDRSQQIFIYPKIELEFSKKAKRGSANEITISWQTGSDRTTLGA
jgi:hypothetical protein